MKKLPLIFLLILQFAFVSAQNFPVRITAQAIPPYPTNLSGYTNATLANSPLRVQIVFTDITATSREVRLGISIEGDDLNATSTSVVVGAPTLILDPGIPLQLSIAELAPYFEQQNLRGISPVQYNGTLPDGRYQFCFEVFDAFNGNRLSAKSCANIFLVNNYPPFLNKPDNKSKITEHNPTNVIFQWTPRHINVPNVSYEFSIVEVWDRYIDPQAVFLSSPPLYQEITTATSLLYGPIHPLLLPGKRYAWRIRAIAANNGEEVSVFTNNGNSEIFWFDYLSPCTVPTNIEVQDVSRTNATISWIGHPDHLDFTVMYRESGSNKWYKKTTPREYVTVDEFKPDTVYEYKILGNCTTDNFAESNTKTFRTLSDELAEYTACGIEADPVDLSNQELLTELLENAVFTAGDFPVYVKKVSGSGSFTGEGYISTPWLATVRIPVRFENIKINTDMKLVDGFVITTYDPNWGSIIDADEIIEVVTGDNDDLDVFHVDFEIENIIVNDDDTFTIIGTDGQEVIREGGENVTFIDSNENSWTVSSNGDVTETPGAEGGEPTADNTAGMSSNGVSNITATGVNIIFEKGSGYYSFDLLPNGATDKLKRKYEELPIANGGTYPVPYKAIFDLSSHQSDVITAKASFSDSKITKDDIVFKTAQGGKIDASWNSNGTIATLSLKKKFDFTKEEILATVKPKDSGGQYTIAGTFSLMHLASQEVTNINIKLISVNGASTTGIANRINEIYNPAGVRFNVSSATPISIADTTIDVGDSELLTYYTEAEKAWISTFKATGTYQKDTYYLFVTDIPPSDSSTDGFMPLKSQFGFVFAQNDKGRVAAHELGHGVFGLEHPFTEYDTQSGSTDLLMDYGTGTELNHMDWEKMYAPGIQIYWFQGDEDGELGGEIWFTPKWKPISIKKSSIIISSSQSAKVKGTLPGFKSDGRRYKALFDTSGSFSGYYEDGKATGKKYEITPINEKGIKDKVYLFVRGEESCNKAYEASYTYAIQNKESIVYNNTNTNIKDSGRIRCAQCPNGKQFIEDYISRASSQSEKEAIQYIANLICSEGDDKIDYDLLVSQIYKNNADYTNKLFWLSQKATYHRALEFYWNPKNTSAFENYLKGIQLVSKEISKHHEKLGNKNISKEELYAGLFYLNEGFLKTLTLQEKKDLLKLVFDNNAWWISESTFFGTDKSDRSLIRKLLGSISNENLPEFVKEIGTDSRDRDRLLYIGYELTIEQFGLFTVDERLEMLKIILNGPVLDNWSATHSTEDLVFDILNSVESKAAEQFLKGLVEEQYRVNGDLLYKQLVDKLNDSFIGDDTNRLNLIVKLKDLVFAAKNIDINSSTTITNGDEYQSLLNRAQCKANYYWNVKNERFLWLFNVVNDQSKLEFRFTQEQRKINLRQDCKETSTQYYGSHYSEQICIKWDTNEEFDPFELVAIEIIEDITFTKQSGACNNSGALICGKVALVPAMFLDYLDRTKNNTRIQNGIFNTLTVASFYFSGGSIIAARGAFSAATFTAYADLFVTIVNPYFSDDKLFIAHATSVITNTFDTDEKNAEKLAKMLQTTWTISSIPLTINTASSIPSPNKHIEAIATYKALVKKIGKTKAKKLIAEDPKLAEKVIKGFEEAEKDIRKSSQASSNLDNATDEIVKRIDETIKITGNFSTLLKNKLLSILPDGSHLKKSISQLNPDIDFDRSILNKLDQLDTKDATKIINDFDKIATEILDPKKLDDLLESWNILRFRSSQIAKIPENSKILAKVANRFTYQGEDAFNGLRKLFNEGSQVQSKQKLINGLKEVDQIFDNTANIPVKFSAIKKGGVTVKEGVKVVDKSGRGDEVARYVDGILQKKKTLDEGEVVGNYDGDDILKNGDEVGFRSNNAGGVFKQVTKAIAKQELPTDFVNALKKMDFTEDEILEYFAKYHNDHDLRFFNEIGDLMKQYPKLNKTDVNLLWGYTTNLFYRRMNGWLRWGENVSKTTEIKNLFNNTLSKLSTFKGTNVYRGIEIDSKGLSDFLISYKKGSKPVWNDFTSAGSSKTASFADRPEINVLFDIKHLDAKDISDFADGIKFRGNPRSEVLIKSGSQFEVTKPPYLNEDKKWVIELIQIQ
ncbi:hypothetical protein [Aquimarina spinulae]|uniref:hypothetical protein n=1 Tax=Aquimarina spinulae TaxID=1192023 RepID=UPI000D54B543|nr:hypothetical protein [Aquimarina spinulae]